MSVNFLKLSFERTVVDRLGQYGPTCLLVTRKSRSK